MLNQMNDMGVWGVGVWGWEGGGHMRSGGGGGRAVQELRCV